MVRDHITNLLKETIGVDAATMGSGVLTNALRQRMEARGEESLPTYWKHLSESEEELAHLVELVVVPETWFFRDAEAFAALVQHVRQEWEPRHPTGRLRVLSAPCSTGEEPYSIAMALLDAGLSPLRFHVDAIDISERALAQAGRAVYGRNSFRGGDLGFRERYFREDKGLHRLSPLVRDCVEFRQGNLVAGDLLTGVPKYDAIFCRNVLIYFDAPTQKKVVRTLERLLVPEGLLFVGPAEAFITRSAGFSTVNFPSAFACRRPGARKVPHPQEACEPDLSPTPPKARATRAPAVRKPPVKPAPRSALAAATPIPGMQESRPPGASLAEANRLANAGRLTEAVTACEAHLREQGPTVEGCHLLALLREMLGNLEEAAKGYRKVLYLDPRHTEAMLHLALLAEKRGDATEARRLRQRAQRSKEVTR